MITFFECSVVPLEYYPWNDNSSWNKYSRDIMDHLFFLLWLCHLITARKQSCGKVLLFTGLSLCRGVSVQGCLCPWGVSVLGSLSRGISVQRGLSPGSLSPWESPGVSALGVSVQCVCSRGVSVLRDLHPGASLSRGSLSRGISVQRGLCPGGSLSLGVSRGSLSWGSLSREVCVQGGLCQGDHPIR